MATPNINIFQTEEHVALALAKYITDLSAKVIADHGSFSIVLSGGTLIDTLRKLVEPPYVSSITWSKWLIFFLDERVVPLDHPDSNYKLAYDGFLSKVPIPEHNIYPIKEKLSPEEAAGEYEQRIKHLVANKTLRKSHKTGFAKFDLILVGMGPEGHVASLFCWHFQRFEKKKWVTFITDSPKPPPNRITFTFPLINSASEIAMVVTGEDAADAIKVALGKHVDGHYPLPVQKVSPEDGLTWFLDKEATSELKLKVRTSIISQLFPLPIQATPTTHKFPPNRITFTFPLINSASEIAVVVTGEDATDAIKVALGKHVADVYPFSVQKVSPEDGLTWFLDKKATSELK